MDISFVIPCYKSENTIGSVVNEIQTKMDQINKYDYEIILVNDASPDNTYGTIKQLCEKNSNIIGIEHAKNFGQHAAIMDGMSFASGDIVVCLDDDGQTPADEVDKLLDKIEEGYDVVYAKYNHKQHSRFRNFGSQLNKLIMEILLGKPKELYVSSYFAAKRFIVDEILKYKNAYPYIIGLVLRATKNICNVDVNHRGRIEGRSGYSLKKLISLWVNGFTSFSVIPLRIASLIGSVIAVGGFIFALYAIIRKLVDPNRLLGWSSTMAAILIIGGLNLIMLGLIGEYIGRIYISINNSPQYVIRNVINYSEEKK